MNQSELSESTVEMHVLLTVFNFTVKFLMKIEESVMQVQEP